MTNKEQLDEMIYDIHQLATRIKAIDRLIISLKDPQLQDAYRVQLLNLIEVYKELCDLLEANLRDYLAKERAESNSVNFTYSRILKSLRV